MEDIIDFQKKKKEKQKKEEARIYGNMLKRIEHLLPKEKEKPKPPKAS